MLLARRFYCNLEFWLKLAATLLKTRQNLQQLNPLTKRQNLQQLKSIDKTSKLAATQSAIDSSKLAATHLQKNRKKLVKTCSILVKAFQNKSAVAITIFKTSHSPYFH
jgi:hypothetical protein